MSAPDLTRPSPAVRSALAAAVQLSREVLASETAGAKALAEALYGGWYCALAAPATTPPHAPPDLGPALRRAHHGSRQWDDGWLVTAAGPDGSAMVARPGKRRRVAPPDYVNLVRPGVPPAPGETVALPARVDWDDPAGWWVTESPEHGSPHDSAVRLYWNVGAAGAGAAVGAITRALHRAAWAWALKCPRDAGGYARRDAIVVLAPAGSWTELAPRLQAIHREIGEALRPGVPRLTKQLARGLAVAEDPGAGESFGATRCRALARALVELRATGGLSSHDAPDSLAARLPAYGVDPACPHLRAAGPDPYEL